MTDTEIRIAAAQYLYEERGSTTPEEIAKAIGTTKEALAYALKKLHPYENPEKLQDNNYIYVLMDENSLFPASYSKNGKTKDFLDNPF